jgi:hypothetical protein
MGVLWFDGLLARVDDAGVYFLPENDVDELLEAAAVNRFPCLRANLAGCRARADLLLRIAGVFAVPPHVVQDFDQLPDALERLRLPETAGQVLVLEHSDDLREAALEDFKRGMEVLQAISAEWATRGLAFWSFVVVSEGEFDALD